MGCYRQWGNWTERGVILNAVGMLRDDEVRYGKSIIAWAKTFPFLSLPSLTPSSPFVLSPPLSCPYPLSGLPSPFP